MHTQPSSEGLFGFPLDSPAWSHPDCTVSRTQCHATYRASHLTLDCVPPLQIVETQEAGSPKGNSSRPTGFLNENSGDAYRVPHTSPPKKKHPTKKQMSSSLKGSAKSTKMRNPAPASGSPWFSESQPTSTVMNRNSLTAWVGHPFEKNNRRSLATRLANIGPRKDEPHDPQGG